MRPVVWRKRDAWSVRSTRSAATERLDVWPFDFLRKGVPFGEVGTVLAEDPKAKLAELFDLVTQAAKTRHPDPALADSRMGTDGGPELDRG